MSDSNVHASGFFALLSELNVELSDHFSVFLGQFRSALLTGILDVSAQKVRWKFFVLDHGFGQKFFTGGSIRLTKRDPRGVAIKAEEYLKIASDAKLLAQSPAAKNAFEQA